MTRHDEMIPRRRRKLKVSYVIIVLLLVITAGVIIFRLRAKSKLESKLQAIQAAGYPVTAAELNAWYSIPESSENAADTILAAFLHYYHWDNQYLDGLPVAGSAELPARSEPMAKEMKALVAEYLSDNKKSLALLAKGSKIQHCRYPVDFTQGSGTLAPHLRDVHQGVKLLALEAVSHAENAEPQPAIDSVSAMFGVARSLAKEPILISQMFRIICEDLSVSTLERVVNRIKLTDKQLIELSQLLEKTDDRTGISRGFAGGRCLTSSAMQDFKAEDISLQGGRSVAAPLVSLYKAVGMADSDALLYIDLMTDYIEATQLEPHQRKKAAEAIEADFDKKSKIHILLHIIRPALSKFVEKELICIAGLQTARAALAVERYRLATGNLPDVLGDLVPSYMDSIARDPFDGEPLRYKKLDVGFVVYSVGQDGQDDGGRERLFGKKGKNQSGSCDVTFIIQR